MNFNQIHLGTKYAVKIKDSPDAAFINVGSKRQTFTGKHDAATREVRGFLYQIDGSPMDASPTISQWLDDSVLGEPWAAHQLEVEYKEAKHQADIDKATRHNECVNVIAGLLNTLGVPVIIENRSYNKDTSSVDWHVAQVPNERGYHQNDIESLERFRDILQTIGTTKE